VRLASDGCLSSALHPGTETCCSQRPAVSALQSAPCSQRPAVSALQSEPCSQRPAVSALQSEPCSQRPAVSALQSAPCSQRPAVRALQSASCSQSPAVRALQSAPCSQSPAVRALQSAPCSDSTGGRPSVTWPFVYFIVYWKSSSLRMSFNRVASVSKTPFNHNTDRGALFRMCSTWEGDGLVSLIQTERDLRHRFP